MVTWRSVALLGTFVGDRRSGWRWCNNRCVHVSFEEVHIGPCRALAFEQDASTWAIVLPGAGYSAQAPLLWYARAAALAAGRSVLVVTDAFDHQRDDPARWVQERAEACFNHVHDRDPHPVLIAKSLTSRAAPFAAREGLPAVWLTPLIASGMTVAAEVLAGLRAGVAPRLLIGGSADPSWDGRVAVGLAAARVVELPNADHSLESPDDVARSLVNLKKVTDAVSGFLRELA